MDPSPAQLTSLAAAHGIVLLVQFGSSVTGTVHARSDIDLAVLLTHAPTTIDAHAALLADLQALFPERDVDLALINRADPLFLKKILEGCRLLYGSTRTLQRLAIYAFKRYQDHRRYLAMERDYVRRALHDASPR